MHACFFSRLVLNLEILITALWDLKKLLEQLIIRPLLNHWRYFLDLHLVQLLYLFLMCRHVDISDLLLFEYLLDSNHLALNNILINIGLVLCRLNLLFCLIVGAIE